MLRILYDDFDQKVKNIHDEMDLHHSYKKKRVINPLRNFVHATRRQLSVPAPECLRTSSVRSSVRQNLHRATKRSAAGFRLETSLTN